MTIGNLNQKYPKSEQTLKRHNWEYQGIKYINDMGNPCEYRLVKDGEELGIMVKYYKGTLLTEFSYNIK